MKTIITILLANLMSILLLHSQENQEKEIFIIGTSHTVPKIVKHSYKKILRRAKEYNPDKIFVESPVANDNNSWEYLKNGWSKNYQKFYRIADSMKNVYGFNETNHNNLLMKSFSQLTNEDLKTLINNFAYLRDEANYDFYKYILKYGINGAKKPTRHEDGDVTYKLALYGNHKKLIAMDYQAMNGLYHEAWQKCAKEGSTNGDNALNRKINKKDYNRAIVPAILGRLQLYANSEASLNRLHSTSSFGYVKHKTKACTAGSKYWKLRNEGMAHNIANEVLNSNSKKNIVLVGASHVVGLREAFKELYPNLKVRLLRN
ncbi:MAG: DUF5694 domain-containing protein [Flavobacteriaceae bacterium]